ncbi:MAG: mannose-1-phosphate guanylyltransferase [Ponticaulis sp.]|nr:mannose-1-phosphate guanylyltransferase [Ponticaulis sp.]|tara:strand:+ start:27993 stop:28715 length:723 start_codon:yes stop_codon:yes gene_type:complete
MDQPIKTAFFLAAGLGTRMRPLSLSTPKPLIPVNGKPLMDYLLDEAIAAGIERAVVNVHYLPQQVESHIASKKGIEVVLSDERDELLETGGAIAKAHKTLGEDPVFIVNTDAFWLNPVGNPFHALNQAYDPDRMDDLLLLADCERSLGYDGKGDFELLPTGQLERRGDRPSTKWAFAGVRITKPGLYKDEAIRPFSANLIWTRLLEAGRLYGLPLDGQWMHVGRPETIAEVEGWMKDHCR